MIDDRGRAIIKQLDCPRCKFWQDLVGDKPPYQPLMSYGDSEYEIFCPHCDLYFDLSKVG